MQTIRPWLTTWEIYPIMLVASFLRFYQLNITEFDEDQAMVFRMARDAVMHGLLPATSNIASIRINNPPGVVYLLMLPASFSANPLWGAVFVALLNVLAVLLTYIFARRYFGRLAGVLAALFYATATMPLHFSRFIWQQNMIAPFVVLFLFALFWGVVDRRKGWLFPALFLLGLVIQLQETTALLAIPLVLAILLAPETVRWRDLVLGLLSLLLLYSTFIIWEIAAKFFDVTILLRVAKLPSYIDNTAFTYYRDFFSPYAQSQIPGDPRTLLYHLLPLLLWLRRFMLILVVGGFITASVVFLLSFFTKPAASGAADEETTSKPAWWSRLSNWLSRLWRWWTRFRASPERCSMLLLLTWQIVPLLALSRHSVPLYPYYLLMLIPGPFILIGLLIERLSRWLRQSGRQWRIPRYSIYLFIGIVLIAQTVGTTARLIDETSGNNGHGSGYNSLGSMQNALNEADHLAQQRHLNHVYISSDMYSQVALRYLAEQMRTPTTVFDAASCLVLPNPTAGPAVYLIGPGDQLAPALLNQFASATLIDQPPRLGGAPYQLFVVQPASPFVSASPEQAFAQNLQLLDNQARLIPVGNTTMLATRWTLLHAAPLAYRTTYTYRITTTLPADVNGVTSLSLVYSDCVFSSIRAGDQLIVTFALSASAPAPAQVSFTASYYVTQPHNLDFGPFQLENIRDQRTIPINLQTPGGGSTLTLNL